MDEKDEQRKLTIKDWAKEDRPREKLMEKGVAALTDAELLAILIGSGTVAMSAVELAKHILKENNNDLHTLATKTYKQLTKIKGIGEAKAITIVSALELGRRRPQQPEVKPVIKSAQDVYELMRATFMDLEHEEFWILLLNRANKVLDKILISEGGLSATVVDPKKVFKNALQSTTSSIILMHNHPSGNLEPSPQDHAITKKLIEGGNLLEIKVLDHLIFTNNGFYSFNEAGYM
ncbi:MAG: JAB domain-containing protein [Cytophagales bacterium]|nr:MAG: JAB domain-containing protein [Cytophagales bacterium]